MVMFFIITDSINRVHNFEQPPLAMYKMTDSHIIINTSVPNPLMDIHHINAQYEHLNYIVYREPITHTLTIIDHTAINITVTRVNI